MESARSVPAVRWAVRGESAANRPKAASMCSQAPNSSARPARSARGVEFARVGLARGGDQHRRSPFQLGQPSPDGREVHPADGVAAEHFDRVLAVAQQLQCLAGAGVHIPALGSPVVDEALRQPGVAGRRLGRVDAGSECVRAGLFAPVTFFSVCCTKSVWMIETSRSTSRRSLETRISYEAPYRRSLVTGDRSGWLGHCVRALGSSSPRLST
jgi:hypothetical protein